VIVGVDVGIGVIVEVAVAIEVAVAFGVVFGAQENKKNTNRKTIERSFFMALSSELRITIYESPIPLYNPSHD
jgi:methylthioribose-1-phosphate isomerase